MKREFLKNLGIEDKDIIDKILDENSTDIGVAKGELETYKTKVKTLEGDLKTKDDEIATLKGKVGDVENLTKEISDLKTDNAKLKNDLDTKVSEITKEYEIENKIRDKKGLNVKAIKALLNKEQDIDEQLDALAKAEDSSMLFGGTTAPTGTHPNNPPSGGEGGNPPTGKTFADAIAQALTK